MMQRHQLTAGFLVACLAGCGAGMQPVKGKVTLADGKPAAGSQVVFESEQEGKKISARGDVGLDGSYELSTFKPGDGVPPGKYKVQVNPPPMVNGRIMAVRCMPRAIPALPRSPPPMPPDWKRPGPTMSAWKPATNIPPISWK